MTYETLLYEVEGPVATITLNRPEKFNAIRPPMWDELEAAVIAANRDRAVKVIVLKGAGKAFCAGFDFSENLTHFEELYTDGQWDPGKDMIAATAPFLAPTQKFMSLWRSPKPVIAQVHGYCVGGGSDLALCADLVVAAEDAQLGTPYSRVWGCYLSGMWIYRLGLARVKMLALTGDAISGKEAAEIGLINTAVPPAALEAEVRRIAARLCNCPSSQLAAMKLIVNQAYEHMGLHSTQTLGPILDGYMRNIPEAHAFVRLAAEQGVHAAVTQRDRPFGDYSQRKK
jgi:enoyl-CoA hydratase